MRKTLLNIARYVQNRCFSQLDVYAKQTQSALCRQERLPLEDVGIEQIVVSVACERIAHPAGAR